MTDLVNSETGIAVVPVLTSALVAEVNQKPLMLIPADWRPVAWNFWSKFASLMPVQLELAANLREWIVEDGLTLTEAEEAFRAMRRPDRRSLVKFPGDVIAMLASEVCKVIEERKKRERQERERERRATETRERERYRADVAAGRCEAIGAILGRALGKTAEVDGEEADTETSNDPRKPR